jgi:ketosteroid isomerase-like protein
MPPEPTTSDLVARVHRLLEASNRGDVDTAMSFFDPDAVWETRGLGTSFEGVTAIRDFVEDWTGAYEEFETVNEEFLDLGNGVTFSVAVARGRPVGSRGHVPFRYAIVGVWVEGKITRFTTYTDIDQARVDAERLAQERG